MKRIIVTGATSMIGCSLIRSALQTDVEIIYAVVRPSSHKLHRLPQDERIRILECSVEELNLLPGMIPANCDVFYHIAWGLTGRDRNRDVISQTRNIQYTLDALHAAKALGCDTFIGAGSQAEYGHCLTLPMAPDSPCNPIQPYGIAKYAAGRLALEEARLLNINMIWVRIFSVYGKHDKPGTMIASTIQKMKAGNSCAFTKGEQIWDFLYEEDAGEAFVKIGQTAPGSRIYCLGSGIGLPLRQYIEVMRDLIDPSVSLEFGAIPYGPFGPLEITADISRLTKDTGWKPTTSFEDGIKAILSEA